MMKPCGQIRLELLEHLYGLLEGEADRALTEHLGDCSICQAELTQAREQMALIAEAAKAEFPNVQFVPPTGDVLLRGKLPVSGRISPIGFRWAVAATVLLAVGSVGVFGRVYWSRQAQVARADSSLRQAKDQVAQADSARLRIIDESTQIKNEFRKQVDLADQEAQKSHDALIRLGQDYQQKILLARTEVNAKQMDLTVIGPRTIQPGALNQFQVQTRSLRQQQGLIPAQISVKVHDQNNRIVFKDENVESSGNLMVSLPSDLPLKPDAILTLEVEARSKVGPAVTLKERLPLTSPVYVTHLTTDKPMYQPGETVRFRSLTLERFSLRPADDDLELNYRIFKPNGEESIILRGKSQVNLAAGKLLGPDLKSIHGIGVGEYLIDANAPTGEYALVVTEGRLRFPPQERRFRVYRPGKAVDKRNSPADADSAVNRKFSIEFFPEGGDLLAGVPNRVYFQAQTTVDPGAMVRHLLLDRINLNEDLTSRIRPAEFKGRIVEDAFKGITDVATFGDSTHPEANRGTGVFEFIPHIGKTYQLMINTGKGMNGIYPLPPVKAEGVVMSIPKAVISDKEPIRVTIRSVGADRSLLVEAYCRGRLMGHQAVDVKKEEVKEVVLGPENGVAGVYRVTVFERVPARAEQLVPRAERLIYRAPANQLHLAIRPEKSSYAPGERVRVNIDATNEKNQPQPAMVMAAVVDQSLVKAANEKTYLSLPAHFFLASEIRRPEDLESADFLLGADAQAAKSLDLLLGTQGWRRFAEQDPGKFQKEQKADAQRLLAFEGQSPLRIVSYGQEEIQKVVREFQAQYAALDKQLTLAEDKQTLVREDKGFQEKINRLREDADLEEAERVAAVNRAKDAQESLTVAAGNLQGHREFLGGLILPIVIGVFLLIAAVNLILAFVRKLQGRAIPYLAGAACSLVLVALAMIQKANLQPDVTVGRGVEIANLPRLDNSIVQLPLIEMPRLPQPEHSQNPPRIAPLVPLNPKSPPSPNLQQPNPPKSRPGATQTDTIDVPLIPLHPPSPKEDRKQIAIPEPAASRDHRHLLPQFPVPAPPPPSLIVREYAHMHVQGQGNAGQNVAHTLYWHPVLVLPDGKGEFFFDLCDSTGRYRILVSGHTLDGRISEVATEIKVERP